MKETHKKMKEAGVLLIATVMILSTVAIADTNESPEFMLAGADYISQSQQTNFDPDWIHFDDGTTVNAIGLTAGGSWEGAIRITPTELVGYDGYEITAVRWHHGAASNPQPSHSGTIKIYDAGTSTNPGSLITSEPYTTAASSDWEEIELSNPAPIDVSKDIWVSVQVTHAAGEFPAGVGPGPVIPGKGGWLTTDGVTWIQLGIDIPTLNYNWNIWAEVQFPSDPPEKPQRPDGPAEGAVDAEYTFCTSTTDPEGEQVYYLWDWGDDTSTDWLGPFDSGATACASHSWTEAGEYDVTVKAKDVNGVESAWSDPSTIFIVDQPLLEIGNITGGLFKVHAVIRNIGSADVSSVAWNITLDGGFVLLGKEHSNTIINIPAGGEVTIESGLILGFGNTKVTVSVEKTGVSSDSKEQEAFIFLMFVIMK